jgi:hypothetical protein
LASFGRNSICGPPHNLCNPSIVIESCVSCLGLLQLALTSRKMIYDIV